MSKPEEWDDDWDKVSPTQQNLMLIEELWSWIEGEFGTGEPFKPGSPLAHLAERSAEIEDALRIAIEQGAQ